MFQAFQFRRITLVGGLLLAGFAALEFRLFWLQVVRHDELQRKAAAFTQTTRVLAPWRGEIRDRTGVSLAVSQPLVTILANLTLCTNRPEEIARCVAPLLDQDARTVAQLLRAPRTEVVDRPTAQNKALVLRRHVPPEQWESISNALTRVSFRSKRVLPAKSELTLFRRLQRGALFTEEEQRRAYPYGGSIALVTGFVGGKKHSPWPQGVFGIEGALDGFLSGQPGFCVSEQDAAGRELPFRRRQYVASVPGKDVVLTVDLNVQQIAERALAMAAQRHHPTNASVLIMRPRTGEILAWASWPGFSEPGAETRGPADWRNHALSDKNEPGSTFKIFTLAAALNEREVTLDDEIFCGNGRLVTNRMVVHDHGRYGWLTVRQAFAKSSNVAFAKIALKLGANRLRQYLSDFGFGSPTGIPLISETRGYLPPLNSCSNTLTLARMGFGQGVAVSQLQMILAVCAICNDGRLMRPMLVSRLESPDGEVLQRFQPQVVRSVISPRTARQIREAMQGVLDDQGTGARGRLSPYTAGGKTGTAQKSNDRGYLPEAYFSSFIGFFPVEEPEICIAVAFDEPRNGHFGGEIAAPVFRVIAEQVGSYLGIPPDKNSAGLSPGDPSIDESAFVKMTDPDSDAVDALTAGLRSKENSRP